MTEDLHFKPISYEAIQANTKLEDFTSHSNKIEGEPKMYDATNAVLGEDKPKLPKDSIFDAVITDVKDGKVSDFISPNVAWQGDREGCAIDLTIEVKIPEQDSVVVNNLFTYFVEDGKTVYTPKSNLGKYHEKYGKLPEKGDQIKVYSTDKGYGKVKIE